jgi:hypothetical protein
MQPPLTARTGPQICIESVHEFFPALQRCSETAVAVAAYG